MPFLIAPNFRHVRGGTLHPDLVPGRRRGSPSPNTWYSVFPNFACDSPSIYLFITLPPSLIQPSIRKYGIRVNDGIP